jgi:hypothetical protein
MRQFDNFPNTLPVAKQKIFRSFSLLAAFRWQSGIGQGGPLRVQRVGSHLGHTGRAASVVAWAAPVPLAEVAAHSALIPNSLMIGHHFLISAF